MNFDPEGSVEIDGQWVTVKFKVPFRRGEEFIHPSRLIQEKVSLAPSVSISLGRTDTGEELSISEIHMNGAWYTASHTQLHGLKEFTRTPADVVNYWSSRPFDELKSMMSSLRRFLRTDTSLLSRIEEFYSDKKRKEVEKEKTAMADIILKSSARINEIEGQE